MSQDDEIRRLERAVARGEPGARSRLLKALRRAGGPSPWRGAMRLARAARRIPRPRVCPACLQVIFVNAHAATECGGDGEGICAEAGYAYDVDAGREPEWDDYFGQPPTHLDCGRIVAEHEAAIREFLEGRQ